MRSTSASILDTPQTLSGARAVPATSLPAPRALRAFELLAAQPISLVGIPPAERDAIVVTAVADAAGHEHPVSRFGDRVWDLAPEIEAKNRKGSALKIVWPDDVPKALIDDAKAALYCAQRRGPHGRKWSGSSIADIGRSGVLALRYLAQLGLADFSQVRALHLSDHIADLRRTLKPVSVRGRLQIVDLVWTFHTEVLHPLLEHPWAGLALWDACGGNEDNRMPSGRTGTTPVIPRSVQRILFAYCEASLAQADELFQARDAGGLGAPKRPAMTSIRNAVLYLLQISS